MLHSRKGHRKSGINQGQRRSGERLGKVREKLKLTRLGVDRVKPWN